jgi:hypothetical protein
MIETIKLKGNNYATVPQRLKEFREKNPRALIETKPTFQQDGTIVFSARIVTDKSVEDSAEATGHSYGKISGEKAFEKLETVATGRALALLGYLNNGQVATTEEMEEFNAYKADQMGLVAKEVAQATTQSEFKEILAKLNPEQKREITPIINARVKELKDGNADKS